MFKVNAYWRLMRFNKPMGTVLLWAPTAWALWLANEGLPNFKTLIIFLLGTVIMRAAGCVINDVADKNYDGHVQRTKFRPLATGEIGLVNALVLFIALLVIALFLVLQLPILCLYQACVALFVTIVYPFCKRFFAAPQLFLGLAFSMGIPMAFAACNKSFSVAAWILFSINFLWIVAYDTIYAMADKKYDLTLGLRSTAIFFASHDKLVVAMLQCLLHFFWLFIADITHLNFPFYIFWLLGIYVFYLQHKLMQLDDETAYFRGFLINGWYGITMWFGLIVGFL